MDFRTPRLLHALAMAVLIGAVTPAVAMAQDAEAPPAVTYRKALMQGLRHSTAAMRTLMGDEVPYTDHVLHQATVINGLAAMMGDVFPDGTAHAESRALASVWDSPGDFSEKVGTIQTAASQLLSAARANDMNGVGEALRAVGGTCRGCHTDFRAR